MITLAIDPGSAGKGSAFARGFRDRALLDVFFAKPKGLLDMSFSADRIVIEKPQADARTENVSARSTIALCWAGGIALGICMAQSPYAKVEEVTPTKWKGSEPKPLQHRRLWAVLTTAERQLLGGEKAWAAIERACEKGALSRWGSPGATYYDDEIHNLLDATALWAWRVGRLKKGGVRKARR